MHATRIALAASVKARFSSTARAAVSSAATSSLRPFVLPFGTAGFLMVRTSRCNAIASAAAVESTARAARTDARALGATFL